MLHVMTFSGICIIINNEVFYKDPEDRGAREMPNREGTQVDAGESVGVGYQGGLGCQIHICFLFRECKIAFTKYRWKLDDVCMSGSYQ